MSNTAEKLSPDEMLADDMGHFYDDPLGYVMYAYQWDTDKSIQIVKLQEPYRSRYNCEYGPDLWACKFLDEIGEQVKKNGFDGSSPVDPIQMSVSSGHGIGKSAITGWLVNWIMSTRPFAKGTVTANTAAQLQSKTWAEIAKWTRKSITGHWFTINSGKGNMKMYHNEQPESWFCTGQTCREENSESFAGQHAANSTSFYIFDEASAIPDKIWEVSEGGMTDGEPMWFAFGNPTRNTGRFKECYGKFKNFWSRKVIDSRDVFITNKKKIQQWLEIYGLDSDFFKVRVRGEFPAQGDKQFIPSDIVEEARRRELEDDQHAPLIFGIDFARSGSAKSVLRARRGRKCFKPLKFKERNSMKAATILINHIDQSERIYGSRPDAIFGDGGGIGGPIIDRLNQLGYETIEVQFGGAASENERYANKRMEIWKRLRDWLVGADIDDDIELHDDLIGPEYYQDKKDRLILESKDDMEARGLASTDDGDSLALTFSEPVERRDTRFVEQRVNNVKSDFDPYAD